MARDEDIGRRQAEVRKLLGMTQTDIAGRLGIPLRTIADNERSASIPGGRVLAAYAGIGVSVDWLLTGGGQPFRTGFKGDTAEIGFDVAEPLVPIATFTPIDVRQSYMVSALERLQRAEMSLSADLIDSMIPFPELGLPDRCRLAGYRERSDKPLSFFDVTVDGVRTDGDYVFLVHGKLELRRIQPLQGGEWAVMKKERPDTVDYIASQRDIDIKGAVVGVLRTDT